MPQSEKSEKKKKPTQKEKLSLIYKGLIALAAVVGILLQCEIGTSDFSLSSLRMFTTLSNLAVAAFFIIYVVMCMMGGARSISTKAMPEKSETVPGKSEAVLGKSETRPGGSEAVPGKSVAVPDRSVAREKTVEYFKFMITMSIMLTGLVAHFMLRKMFVNMESEVKAGLVLLHYVVPIATFLDWILFDEKGRTDRKMPLFAALFPIIYVAVSMIAAQFMTGDNRYPYPFLNVDMLGAGTVAMNIVLLTAAFFTVGYLGVWADHRLAGKKI